MPEVSDYWRIYLSAESNSGIGGEFTPFKRTKYFCDDLTLAKNDLQCFNSVTESSSEYKKIIHTSSGN